MNISGRALFAALALILLSIPFSRAESVLVEEFQLESDEVPVPCDVESIIRERLRCKGCDVTENAAKWPPDIIVTGSYWVSGGNSYATVKAVDIVKSQLLASGNLYLPTDPAKCMVEVEKLAEAIGDPPSYARKKNFLDAYTGQEFVYVPGGSYRMGAGKGERVSVAEFYMGAREVNQKQWMDIMGSNPSFFRGDPNLPVENVSWYDVMDFIRRLNEKTGLKYRLPTEAEWEFAARTRGRSSVWSGTDSEANLAYFAWISENSNQKTHPVGSKRANALGLYDMSGNVWEWCQDRARVSKSSDSGEARVIRGGSWMMDCNYARTTAKETSSPESRFQDNGFRLAMDVTEPGKK